MQIFVVNEDFQLAGQALDDKRVNKMLLESTQMLCTALHIHGASFPDMYAPTHMTGPFTLWTAKCRGNFEWLWNYAFCLSEEWSARFAKVHGCHRILEECGLLRDHIPEGERTAFHNGTGLDEPDVFQAYRQYLLNKWQNEDRHPPRWSNRRPPRWAERELKIRRTKEGKYFVERSVRRPR